YDLPPGLTLSASGVLSGTPSKAGQFFVGARITDNGGNDLTKLYRVTIDNAAGEAPAVTLGTNPIRISYTLGMAAALAPIPVAVNSTSGTHAFTLNLAGAP